MSPESTEQIEQTEILTDEVDEVAEALAAHDIISEERHAEIITEVEECRNRLERLLNQESAENPILSQIQAEVSLMKAQMLEILASLRDMKTRSNPIPSELVEVVAEVPIQPAEQNPEKSTVEPAQAEIPVIPVPEKTRRFHRI